MYQPIIGMDFGTTNSGMAIDDGRGLRFLSLDKARPWEKVIRTAVYLTTDQQLYIGHTAVDTYLAQNSGRAIRMEKVWVGEIEIRGADMRYVDDLYVYTDVLSPGRLFLSIKSGLREADYVGTVIGQFFYSLEDLIALYLTATRERATQQLGYAPRHILLGRPVHFAFSHSQDQLAQNRLLDAAFRAGYEQVYFQYEPIAAAYSYAASLPPHQAQTILVFDFGGGTLDVTIMRLGANHQQKEILATGGIPIAGDVFDQKLVRAKLPRHFGEGSYYRADHKRMPVPSWIYDTMADWQHILELQAPHHKQMLAEIAAHAERPREIAALISLVAENYALNMFQAAEEAKRELSDKLGAIIKLDGPAFHIRQMVTRTDFETIIREEVLRIERHLRELVSEAGLTPAQIDVVVRTGGSAEIPVFRQMLGDMFGAEKLQELDTFGSVTAGLGLMGHSLAEGELELPAYTPADLAPALPVKQGGVSPVNLRLLQKRIVLEEGNISPDADAPTAVLVWLTAGNRMGVSDAPLPTLPAPLPWFTAVTCPPTTSLLLLTNLYRFLLITPRQLEELAELQMGLADLHQFRHGEEVCALGVWDEIKTRPWLAIPTSRGYVRAYRLSTLAPLIESPAPYQFDEALPGVPIALLGVQEQDELLLVADNGRALRLPLTMSGVRVRGVQALPLKETERLCAAQVINGASEVEWVLATGSGHGKRFWAAQVPLAQKPNQKPPQLTARQPVVGVLGVGQVRGALLAGEETRPCDPHTLPPAEDSSKTFPWLKLPAGGELLGLF
jgi:hypothetical chaperone protein